MVVAFQILLLVLLIACILCARFIDNRTVRKAGAEISINTTDSSIHERRDLVEKRAYVERGNSCGRVMVRVKNLRRETSDQDDSDKDINDDLHLDKILGGIVAGYGEFPWMANIQYNRMTHCGGAIINAFWIITAAHCLRDRIPESFRVIVGDYSLMRHEANEANYKVDIIILPAGYIRFQNNWDIALLKIRPDKDGHGIAFNNYVQPVCLADAYEDPRTGIPLLFSGWGDISAGRLGMSAAVLMKTYLPVQEYTYCSYLYPNVTTTNNFCAGFVNGENDLCKGDSGGPAVFKPGAVWVIYGVASFGTGCGGRNYPVVFSNVARYRNWIEYTINSNSNGSEAIMPTRNYEGPLWDST